MDRDRLTVTMDAGPRETRLLVMEGRDERLRALLGPATETHPRAAVTLLEGLALWHQRPLAVALYVDERASSSAMHLYDGLDMGARSVHFEVVVVPRASRAGGHRIGGFGRFADLRQLALEGVLR